MARIPELFGIDIGFDSIKFAYTEKKGDKFVVQNIYQTKTQQTLLNYDVEENIAELAKILQNAHKTSGIRTKNCVAAIPEEQVFSRLISLPEITNEDELDEAIHYSIKPIIPIPIQDVSISKLQIDTTSRNGQNFINWYVVAAPLSTIRKMTTLMEMAGFNLEAIETEALAVTRLMNVINPIDEDVMILDIGAESTNIIVAKDTTIMFSQSIGTGSDSITKVIQSDYGIDYEKAERYKVDFGLNYEAAEGKIAKSIAPVADIIIEEISRTIAYYREKLNQNALKNIYLTGGGASLIGLDKYIELKLNIKTHLALDLGQKLVISENELKEHPTAILNSNVAVGLSLKGFLDLA